MKSYRMNDQIRKTFLFLLFLILILPGFSQVNAVEFGKNRVQFTKFRWKFYQSPNFNVYFTQDGLELAKFVGQLAEKDLPGLEQFIEYSIQRRVNIVVYNSFNDLQQSNIGIGIDWQNSGGVTKLVNNKMVVYFNGNHNDLRRQIREGIARVLVENLLFGDDLGEFAGNQALLDLPKWLTDGYISYAAENWSPALDNDLKSAMLGFQYNTFYQFAYEKPELAGHAFWWYIEEKYKRENVTYLLYLARIYKNLNRACEQIAKEKFKKVLGDFMQFQRDKYFKDIRGRRNVPAGRLTLPKEIGKTDYFRFQANPNPKSFTYAVVEFKRGQYCIVLNENFIQRRILYKSGVRNLQSQPNPNYPMMAWDPKGTRLAALYWEEGKLNFFVYDMFARIKRDKQDLTDHFDLVQDMQYMLDENTLLFSAVKNGHSDIYVYKIREQKLEQITNDVYDDLDASFVAFPNKTGIIFASNRPSPNAPGGDTVLPSSNRYNIFLVDNWNKSEFKQISQLTNIPYGNARYPMQYNTNHFTYISEQNGIGNRYAGFFSTKAAGIDTILYIGDEVLRNPEAKELDSTLRVWDKSEPDSVGYVRITDDSTYTFPLTNYQSSILETRIAGDNGQVTEVNKQGNFKFLYKLRVDENTLRKRNVNARPTDYIRKLTQEDKIKAGTIARPETEKDTTAKEIQDFFESEFNKGADTTETRINIVAGPPKEETLMNRFRLFNYKKKFYVDYVVAGFNNTVLFNRYQPYNGGTGPIYLSNDNQINGLVRMAVPDLMEDIRFIGAYRIASNLKDNEYLFGFQNLRKRLDWGINYYRSSQSGTIQNTPIDARIISNIYQANIIWPFNQVQSLRAFAGIRVDKQFLLSNDLFPPSLTKDYDQTDKYFQGRLEYVHDNTISPTLNIWKGLRYKAYMELFTRLGSALDNKSRTTFNAGFDARHYLEIYRNFIWAVRAAADISWGDAKLIYYLGGTDGWVIPKFNDAAKPDQQETYAYQTLAVNLRGFPQNAANGNNALVINSELRLPVLPTLLNRPINNAFLRNFQLIQFFDLGTAWNGRYNKIKRPSVIYPSTTDPNNPVEILIKAGGIGPFIGGYGFGARSTILGYFIRFDAGWEMRGFFRDKPTLYLSFGLDF